MNEELQKLIDEETSLFNAYIEAKTKAEEAQMLLEKAQQEFLEAKARSWAVLRQRYSSKVY